eukprot:9768789-Alexandrium_andersonii.AAC.1
MSASLVGSEMCIRDRFDRYSVYVRGVRGVGAPPAPLGRRNTTSQRSGAVSYTHLTLPTICSV